MTNGRRLIGVTINMPSTQNNKDRRKRVYERVREYIMRNTTGHPSKRAVQEQHLKLSLVAHGDLEADEVNRAMQALGEQEKIQYGSGWITPVIDEQWHRDAVAYVVENSTGDVSEFVAVANTAIAEGDV